MKGGQNGPLLPLPAHLARAVDGLPTELIRRAAINNGNMAGLLPLRGI